MKSFKKDFPIFKKKINGKRLVYLDSTATSQKPKAVIDAISQYYETCNANVRRGLYPLSEKATEKMEDVREKVARFINAKESSQIIFVRNTTEAINLVAHSWGRENIQKGDIIVTTIMEHHSNFVPWQALVKEKGAKLEIVDIDDEYKLKIKSAKFKIIIQNSKLLVITHASNVLGVINPVEEIIRKVKIINPKIKVLVDGAQSLPHIKVDVQKIGCDFLAFSGHKMMAGTGIGVLYGKKELLEEMKPFLFGGEMVSEVTTEKTLFAGLPYKFEAGTPDIAGIISLGAAIDYLKKIGMGNIQRHEQELTKYCMEQMEKIEGLKIYGPLEIRNRVGAISFNLDGIHPHDVAQVLGDMGICIRAGYHCAMPLHSRLGLSGTARASFYLYNNRDDIYELIKGIKKVIKIFSK